MNNSHDLGTVVICTALPIEYLAVREHLPPGELDEHDVGGMLFASGTLATDRGRWRVVLGQSGAGNIQAAVQLERAVQFFQPRLVLFVGVAGGLKDVTLGDVAVASLVYEYETGKDTASGFHSRRKNHHCNHRLVERAHQIARDRPWHHRILNHTPKQVPRAVVNPLAAGSKVTADRRSATALFLREHCGDAIAVEMEGAGFLHGAYVNDSLPALVVRGISDLLDDKTEAADKHWQPMAARHAAAFAIELLHRHTRPTPDPHQPTAHDSAPTTNSAVTNTLHGTATGTVFQIGVVHGGIYTPLRPQPPHSTSPVDEAATDRADSPPAQVGRPGPSAVVTAVPAVGQSAPELFVGRDDALQRLLDFLQPNPNSSTGTAVVSAVAGMGGIGKTTLARRAAMTAVECGWFTGAALTVDLHGYDPSGRPVGVDQVFAPLLRGLGATAEPWPVTVAEQAAVYHHVLDRLAAQGRRLLLILDNASTSDQVRDLLPQQAAHRALVTTRDTLTLPSATRLELGVLTAKAAADLVEEQLRRAWHEDPRLGQDRPALLRMVELCGWLPLALTIAAARLVDEPEIDYAELVSELEDSPRRMAALQHGESSLGPVYELSWNHLRRRNPQAATLLTLLASAPGLSLSTQAAAALAGTTSAEVGTRLRTLWQAHLLLRQGKDRWALHDVIRFHAREHCFADDVDAAVDRLLTFYLHHADAADDWLDQRAGQQTPEHFAGREHALAWFEAEHASLVAAVDHAVTTGRYEMTVRLAACLLEFQRLRYRTADRLRVTQQALTAARELGDRHSEGKTWNNLGLALQEVGRFDDAISAHQHARTTFQELGDRHSEGKAWNNLGLALQGVGRFDDAISAHQHDLTICQELGDRHSESKAWNNLGLALQEVGRFDDAISAHQHARTTFQELGDRHGEGMAWNNLGNALQKVGRFDDAISAHQHDLTICQELGDRHSEGKTWNNLGNALQKVGRFDDAISAHQHARTTFQELGDRHSESKTWNNLGNALQKVGRFDDAISAHQHARTTFQELGDRHSESKTWNNLGLALQEVGRFDDAKHAAEEAAQAYAETGDTQRAAAVRELLKNMPP
ncbi:tetratricopeptide repeat protein [Crossiella sp. SN42]|uniref:tetratricopeptide repeat protein n=1 Tax=Crossiella sp. SN42 TaxID=2944808 RepID=UPI00207C3492|nr:tetratricopeptide repeat protein [Crossiella sp. SN42]MCO1575155.1 tetratricopeptide repeat protein [Crossiella sp. SN42]